MEPIWGLALYAFVFSIVLAIGIARKVAWEWFLLTPVAGFGLAVLGSLASGGSGIAAGLMGFSSLLVAFFAVLAMKSEARKLADGDRVEGFKKCPYCAESVREEAVKCKHCGSQLIVSPEST